MNQPTQNSPAPRIPLELIIEFRKSYSRASDNGRLTNISISGAFIESDSRFDKNDKLNMTFEVGGRVRKIAAKVVWTNERGAGLMFQHFNNRDVQLIDDLMYFIENNRESRRDVLSELFKKVA